MHNGAAPRVRVIVLVQRNAPVALAALRALRASTSAAIPFETIVLLNGADDATVAAIQRGALGATVLVSSANLGFGGGCNLAAGRANTEYLAFLNDDTVVDPGWLEALVAHADADDAIAAVGSRIRYPDGTLQEAGSIVWSDGTTAPVGWGLAAAGAGYRFRRDVTYASASALLVRRRDFEAAGGFDEAFFPAYYEDVDLCLTFAAAGKRVTFEPTAELVHLESQSSSELFKTHLFHRNHRRIVAKWGSLLPAFQAPAPESLPAVERALDAAWGKRANVLVIDDRLPDGSLGSGFGRMLELIADLAATPYRTFFYASMERGEDARRLGEFGVELIARPLAEELSAGRRFDIAIISRPNNFEVFAGVIRELQPECRICYDVESLFYRRFEKQALTETEDAARAQLLLRAEDGRRLEFEIARSVDRLVCISTDERHVLESIPGHAPLEFIVPVARAIAPLPGTFAEREPLALFVAGWLAGTASSPNADGLRWLGERVMPLLRARLPQAKIVVTGANPPADLRAYASPSLEFAGHVSDLPALYRRARATVCPPRFGAGVKIKTVESIQYGLPVVATTVGAEGIELSEPAAIAVADDPRDFADALVEVLADRQIWERRRTAAVRQADAWRRRDRTWADVCDAMIAGEPAGALGLTQRSFERGNKQAQGFSSDAPFRFRHREGTLEP